MNKKITLEQIKDAFKRTRAKGIRPECFLFIGIPGESEETIKETNKLMDELEIDPKEIGILEIYPNTQIYEFAKTKNFVDDDYWMSEKPIPLYTKEHSYEKLRQMANSIVLHRAKKNKLGFFLFVLKHLLLHPIKTIKMGIERKYFQRFLGIR